MGLVFVLVVNGGGNQLQKVVSSVLARPSRLVVRADLVLVEHAFLLVDGVEARHDPDLANQFPH